MILTTPLVLGAMFASAPPVATHVIERHTDDATLAILHVDVANFNFEAAFDAMITRPQRRSIDANDADHLRSMYEPIEDALHAHDATDVFACFSMLEKSPWKPAVIIPTSDATTASELSQTLSASLGGDAGSVTLEVHGSDVVIASAARHAMLRENTFPPAPEPWRKSLSEALSAHAETGMAFIVDPTPSLRRSLPEAFPDLGPAFGNEPTSTLTRSVRRSHATLATTPSISFAARAFLDNEVSDAEAARIEAWMEGFLAAGLANLAQYAGNADQPPLSINLERSGDHLSLQLTSDEIAALVDGALFPAVAETRRESEKLTVGVAMRNAMVGIMTYATEHDGAWPPSLDLLIEQKYIAPFPDSPRNSRMDYRIPTQLVGDVRAPDQTPVIVEVINPNRESGFWVAWADGHVSIVTADELADIETRRQAIEDR